MSLLGIGSQKRSLHVCLSQSRARIDVLRCESYGCFSHIFRLRTFLFSWRTPQQAPKSVACATFQKSRSSAVQLSAASPFDCEPHLGIASGADISVASRDLQGGERGRVCGGVPEHRATEELSKSTMPVWKFPKGNSKLGTKPGDKEVTTLSAVISQVGPFVPYELGQPENGVALSQQCVTDTDDSGRDPHMLLIALSRGRDAHVPYSLGIYFLVDSTPCQVNSMKNGDRVHAEVYTKPRMIYLYGG